MEPYLPFPRRKMREIIFLFIGLPHVFAETDLAIVDSDVESAFRIRADPRFVSDGSPIPTIV